MQLIESRTFAAEDKIVGKHLPLRMTATIEELDDTVEIRSGRFPHCLHVVLKGTTTVRADRGHAVAEVAVEHQEWYAPGVGLVRTTRTESSKSTFLVSGSYTQVLVEFSR